MLILYPQLKTPLKINRIFPSSYQLTASHPLSPNRILKVFFGDRSFIKLDHFLNQII